uniref:Uncharacterized protein n=1 Tax=Coccidioides posadasii RMSCC 3488 TaxID=454284 RepID=A0A0J6FPK3_COCPO|nr:hypothetical protein CPAG_08600 [Coccidioides posadasii RMSCC 3488]
MPANITSPASSAQIWSRALGRVNELKHRSVHRDRGPHHCFCWQWTSWERSRKTLERNASFGPVIRYTRPSCVNYLVCK